jgi:hypothetical protein
MREMGNSSINLQLFPHDMINIDTLAIPPFAHGRMSQKVVTARKEGQVGDPEYFYCDQFDLWTLGQISLVTSTRFNLDMI